MSVRYVVWETLAGREIQPNVAPVSFLVDRPLTANSESCCCSADDGQQDSYGRILEDEARKGEGGDIRRHGWECTGCNKRRRGVRVPALERGPTEAEQGQ